jgi:hypothetical protein
MDQSRFVFGRSNSTGVLILFVLAAAVATAVALWLSAPAAVASASNTPFMVNQWGDSVYTPGLAKRPSAIEWNQDPSGGFGGTKVGSYNDGSTHYKVLSKIRWTSWTSLSAKAKVILAGEAQWAANAPAPPLYHARITLSHPERVTGVWEEYASSQTVTVFKTFRVVFTGKVPSGWRRAQAFELRRDPRRTSGPVYWGWYMHKVRP